MQPSNGPSSASDNSSGNASVDSSVDSSGSTPTTAPAASSDVAASTTDATPAAPVAPEIARLLADTTLPEPVRRFLTAGGELEQIRLDEQGQWSHQGAPFLNAALSALFSRSLVRTPGGTWVLQIAPFSYPVQLADTPYYVRNARLDGDGVILSLNDETEEKLVPGTLRYVEGRGLYCQVKTTSEPSGHAARLLRPAYFALADRITEGSDGFALTLGAQRIQVPVVSWEAARATAT